MNRLVLTAAALLLFADLSWGFVPATPPAEESIDKERSHTFAWMDGLGYGDLRKMPFVRVETGNQIRIGNGPTQSFVTFGFLVHQQGNRFRIMDLSLRMRDFDATAADVPRPDRVAYQVVNLGPYAAAIFEGKQLPDVNPAMEQVDSDRNGSEWLQTVVLSWGCSRKGLDDLASKLYKKARDSRAEENHLHYHRSMRFDDIEAVAGERPARSGPLKPRLTEALAEFEIGQAFEEYLAPDFTRQQLLQRLERIARKFPEGKQHDRAGDMTATLREMVVEDAVHAVRRQQGKPLDKLPRKEQIAELIYRLRDATDGGDPSPALVEKGYDAVPQLIETLNDKRLTRIPQGYGRGIQVQTVGDSALIVLRQISGKNFRGRDGILRGEDVTVQGPSLAVEIRVWYEELRVKGEKNWLIDAVKEGDDESVELARRLVERHARDALPALIAGARNASATGNSWIGSQFVELAGTLNTPESLSFILDQVRTAPMLDVRLAAARCLAGLNRPEGLAAMLDEWSGKRRTARDLGLATSLAGSANPLSAGALTMLGNARTLREEGREDLAGVAQFLLNTGSAEVVAAMARDLSERPVDVRFHVVWGLQGSEAARNVFSVPEPVDAESIKMRAAIEDLLMSTLSDRTVRTGFGYSSSNNVNFSSPRMCDLAGFILNELAPHRYSFNIMASIPQRNRRLTELRNVGRQANKLPPLPVPEPLVIAEVSEKRLRPLLDRLQSASPTQRLALQAEIEKFGPGAFLAVLDRRDRSTNKADEEYFDNLAKRLASTVTEVEFAEKTRPNPELARALARLKGKPLDPATLFPALEAAVPDLSPQANRLTLYATRSGDGTGVALTIEVAKDDQSPNAADMVKTANVSLSLWQSTKVAGQESFAFGDTPAKVAPVPRMLEELHRALSATPGESIAIEIRLTAAWR